MDSKQSCNSQLFSPEVCTAVSNRGGGFLSVIPMLNFYSLSLARNLCHSFPVMPSELFLPSFPKGPKYSLLVNFLPYSTWRCPRRLTRQSIGSGNSSWDALCFLSLKLVMPYFMCTLKVIFWAPAIMEQDQTILLSIPNIFIVFQLPAGALRHFPLLFY